MKKLLKIFKNLRYNLLRNLNKWEFDLSAFFLQIILIVMIIALGYNVYIAYQKGIKNSQLESEASQKLAELKAESRQLDAELQYYGSVEFKKIYARDTQNLAQPGESLYYVERPEQQQIENYEVITDPIVLDNYGYWWRKLILGL